MNNIILIGMPGCGKTWIGRALAEKLNRPFCDLDLMIEELSGMKIPEIFERCGEKYFRDVENQISKETLNLDNYIIATGGGIVKNKENIDYLSKSGKIIFIDRDLEDIIGDIDISTRPILNNDKNKITELYKTRYELYKEYSDMTVLNDSTVEEVISQIIENIK